MKMIGKVFLFAFSVVSSAVFSQGYTSSEISLIRQGNPDDALSIMQTTEPHQHGVLLEKSTNADPIDPNTAILVGRMKRSLQSTESGVGIAAPQVGINRNIIWVKRFDKLDEPLEYFINPLILWKSKLQNRGPEGDLSIPDFRDDFYRSKVIQLEYFDLKGNKHTEIVEGFTAVIFQHEIDHLSGILISDKIKQQEKETYEKVEAYLKIK